METDYTSSLTVEEIEANAYDVYARLRRESPVAYVPALNSWLVTKWDDVQRVTTSPDLFGAEDDNAPVVRHFGSPAIIHSDGPVHRELRNGIAPHYSPRKVAEYIDDLVRPLALECIKNFPASGEVDLVADYIEPISVQTLARSFGVTGVTTETLQSWFHGLAMGAINFARDPDRTKICDETKEQIHQAFDPIFARLENAPDNSPLSNMLYHSMEDGQRRSREFVMPSILVTLLGGMQEPGHGGANTLVALLENPDQMAQVRSDPDAWLRKAVSEATRWVAPIGTQGRISLQDVDFNGVIIPAGQAVSAVIASANRDEEKFAHPDNYDINRSETSYATFGFGAHFCAGKWMSLAQMELSVGILLDTFPDIQLMSDKPYSFFGWEFRAPTKLWVQVRKS